MIPAIDATLATLAAQISDVVGQLDSAAAEVASARAELEAAEQLRTKAQKLAARLLLVPGTYVPDETNTGLIDPGALVDQPDNLTYTGAFGVIVIESRRFLGYVFVRGGWVRFRNCLMAGPLNPTMETVQARYAATHDVVFEDCEFSPRSTTDRCGNITGQGYTMIRCLIRNGVDGVTACPADGLPDANVHLVGCLIDNMAYFKPSTTHSDGQTHSDPVVIIGANVTINGCCVRGNVNPDISSGAAPGQTAMSAIMFNQRTVAGYVQRPARVRITNSWFAGGIVCFNLIGIPDAFATADGSIIEGNHFKADQSTGPGHLVVCVKGKQAGLLIQNNFAWTDTDPLSTSGPVSPRVNI